MRIGMVTGEYPPMEGGVGAFTEQLALGLSNRGHEVHVITSKLARPAETPKVLSSVFEPIEHPFGWLHPRINRWRWPALAIIADVAIRYDLDIVNLQYQAAAFDMRSPAINFLPWRLKGITQTVVTFHDLRVPYLFPKAGSLRKRSLIFMARQASGCIFTDPADYQEMRELTDRPVCHIPIGSNIDAYGPNHLEIEEVREKFTLREGDFLLGYFGFLSETKGADSLVEALAKLEDRFHLVFIGGQTGASDAQNNQEYLLGLKTKIDGLGLADRIHWTGFQPAKRVSAFLGACDLMVMPYRDGVSLRRGTLMAVLAHGRPLITTVPAGDNPAFQHGENMWLVTPDSTEDLMEAIANLSANGELRAHLGKGARILAAQFGWDAITEKTATFFASLQAGSSA